MLTKRRFRTTDNRGCEFHATIYRNRKYQGGPIDEECYVADGTAIAALSLKELKRKISEID